MFKKRKLDGIPAPAAPIEAKRAVSGANFPFFQIKTQNLPVIHLLLPVKNRFFLKIYHSNSKIILLS